jgi:pimeloyl-ACP methyl ester carboxylesterase
MLRINDFQMAFDDRGSKHPLLFIHGYPLNRTLWEPQITTLSATMRVIAPDLRGHGDSSLPAGVRPGFEPAHTMEQLADDCASLLDALGVEERVVICGLSMGGYVTLEFYRKYPHRVAGIILTATRAGADSLEGKANRDKAIELARQSGSEAIAQSMLPKMMSPKTYTEKPDLVNRVSKMMQSIPVSTVVGDLLGMRDRSDSTQLLPLITAPTLVIHGADDQLIPLAEMHAMHAAIPGSTPRIIPNAGHLLNLEQPELFNQAVLEYLHGLK